MSVITYQFAVSLERRFLTDTIALYLFDRSPALRARSKLLSLLERTIFVAPTITFGETRESE